MNSIQQCVFRVLNRSILNPRNAFEGTCLIRSYRRGRYSAMDSLYSRICSIGNPNLSVVPVLDQWLQEGKNFRDFEHRQVIRNLRYRKRYFHALEISEWMSGKGLLPLSPGDCAVQLDLIGTVRGLKAAEIFFHNLSDQEKIDKTYGALLNCYVREGLIDKSLSLMQKMKEMGFASSALSYNDIMCLYAHTGQIEKIPDVLSEMKKNGVSPNNFSYKICINSYGRRSQIESMEKVLEEMENDHQISVDWSTYCTVANCYIKNGFNEKALIFLKKSETKLHKDAVGYNYLISLYANLGKKDDVMRLWSLQKVVCKKLFNRDYIVMLSSLVKLDELEETEALVKEWESSCLYYDFRVPNVLLIGYCQKGLIEKAEASLQDIIERGKTPTPNSWAIIAAAHLDKQNMGKALECMKEALAVQAENQGWRPKPRLIISILNWLDKNGEVEELEAFLRSLENIVLVDRELCHALAEANFRSSKVVVGIEEGKEADKIDEDEEEKNLLGEKNLIGKCL
ncbi:pentatricopeptide repeat-containing protein At4g21705, mitochondrial-like [Cornus florida]|uniref:pentatricopeptide repeat-containing protein At4g21705, mitochondrial-like n=1 Tax=Cornus florida TaxID=4283 RepID=UPI00289A189B|nr:pentatricopeptide repeat-containing protein At4g21705, mitochondrial-like [Cornus florida]